MTMHYTRSWLNPSNPPSTPNRRTALATACPRAIRMLPPLPSASTGTTGPSSFPANSTSMQTSLAHVTELRAERERAWAHLKAVEAQLQEELDSELAMLLPMQSTEAMQTPGHTQQTDLDNFGYIRQYSGEPYDSTKAMGVPGGLAEMGIENFLREGRSLLEALGVPGLPKLLRGTAGSAPPAETEEVKERRRILSSLTLSNAAIWEREHAREPVKSPWIIKIPYYGLCFLLDIIFYNRPIPRFWLLETVARMPYFSYINMLHLYETLGWWRRSMEARKVHFAEEWNEAHHLLIMESLGGDQAWVDRFIAQHAAVVYYVVLLLLWIISPTLAYNFSELIEAHAVDTYAQFVDENAALLKQLPPPRVARLYYEADDMYLFEQFQTEREPGSRFVAPGTLYDVFCNIRDDEAEHVATMHAMQRQDILDRAPNVEALALALGTLLLGANLWRQTMTSSEIEGGAAIEGLSGVIETVTIVVSDMLSLLVGL